MSRDPLSCDRLQSGKPKKAIAATRHGIVVVKKQKRKNLSLASDNKGKLRKSMQSDCAPKTYRDSLHPSRGSTELSERSCNGSVEFDACIKPRRNPKTSSVAMAPPTKRKKKFLHTLESKDLPCNNGTLPEQNQGKQAKTKKRKSFIGSSGGSSRDSTPHTKEAKVTELMTKQHGHNSSAVSGQSIQFKFSSSKRHGFEAGSAGKNEDVPQKRSKSTLKRIGSYAKKEAGTLLKMDFLDDIVPHQTELDEFRSQRRSEELSSLDVLVQAASGFEDKLRNHDSGDLEYRSQDSEMKKKKRKIMVTNDDSNLTSECKKAGTESLGNNRHDVDDQDMIAIRKLLKEFPEAPLVQSRRGRTQTLPSRFRDSILDEHWKKPRRRSMKNVKSSAENDKFAAHKLSSIGEVEKDTHQYVITSSHCEKFEDGQENHVRFDMHAIKGEKNELPKIEEISVDDAKETFSSTTMDIVDSLKPSTTLDMEDMDMQDCQGTSTTVDMDNPHKPLSTMDGANTLNSHSMLKTIARRVLRSKKKALKESSKKNDALCRMNKQCFQTTADSEAVQLKNNSLLHISSCAIGDIVWVKLETANGFVWPAKVVDPTEDVPESILKAKNPFRLCVMFYATTSREEAFAWVKRSMVFSFIENLDRFKVQKSSRPIAFKLAVEEAIFEEFGIEQCQYISKAQLSSESWESICKLKDSVSQSDSLTPSKQFQKDTWNKENECCVDSKAAQEEIPKSHIMDRQRDKETFVVIPDQIAVVCYGMEAKYIPKLHQILCECGYCTFGQMMGPSKWERHTGSRKKKWKQSIKLKNTNITLLSWLQFMMRHGAAGLAYTESNSSFPSRQRERKLAAYLQQPYQPVIPNWPVERCVVGRRSEDYDWNKIMTCNRCGLAVHEICYGKKASNGLFICRVCENPDIEHECCLCHVKGGALMPSTIYGFWVHITCAWFIEEISFKNIATMEPADGLTNISPSRFQQACVACKQIYGVCVRCVKCPATYHVMCAAQAGYCMELHTLKRNGGRWESKKISYYANHRTPDPDAKLFLVSSDKECQIVKHFEGNEEARMFVIDKIAPFHGESILTRENRISSASRCLEYSVQMKLFCRKKTDKQAIAHTVGGYSWHSPEVINSLMAKSHIKEDMSLYTQSVHLQRGDKTRVCCGRSAIHGWGLFARRPIQEGEMVVEYRGELVRRSIADLRERHYSRKGKGCYFFKMNDEAIIDATEKGNVGRLINHSCAPNCYARIFSLTGVGETGIVLIARRSLNVGEELTYDYQFDPENRTVACRCGAETCRKFMC